MSWIWGTLRNPRENVTDKVVSVPRIGLLFSLQSHIVSKHNIGYNDCLLRLVYIDLKAIEEEYALVNDMSEFEFL